MSMHERVRSCNQLKSFRCSANKTLIGFRFNSLCPAPLNTPLLQDWLGDDKEKRFRREVHFPSGRFGEAIEQAHAVIFLASDESSFVNATDFVVDGGLTKAYVTPEGPATEAPKNLAGP